MKYPEIKFGQMEAIINKLGGEEGVLKFLRGELVVQPAVVPEPISEPAPDFIVRVDRSVKPSYPDWMKKLMLTGTLNLRHIFYQDYQWFGNINRIYV